MTRFLGGLAWLVLVAAGAGHAPAQDPYDAWAQGRPAEAVPLLLAGADDRWDRWYDAGLAAAAAEDRGRAVACLAQAATLAPGEGEPRQALRALGIAVPASWHERAGPLAWPGQGWAGVVVLTLAGLALGWALTGPRWRRTAALVGLVAVAVAGPGLLARTLDRNLAWAGTVRATHLLDSAGSPRLEVPAGTLVTLIPGTPWAGRVVARLPSGEQGFLPLADLRP